MRCGCPDVFPENVDRSKLEYGALRRAQQEGPVKRSKFSEEQVVYALRQEDRALDGAPLQLQPVS